MPVNKRKKHHDKDKYYHLAKEQGLRSRAAFKLTQINRKFSLLTPKTQIVLDLCAAPGGWTQICQRILPSSESIIVAVDLLPIRPISNNVITLVGDITTSECQSQIRSELQNASVDVVLCDGAPSVGAAYERDAYMQNEIALWSLKCAVEHLKRDGKFLTKLYRSKDYASYLWVAKQLFKNVKAVKPTSSRSQSAEIFLVCEGFLKPDKIDPKMLDPKCVFAEIEDGVDGDGKAKGMTIFHKKWDEKRRSRQGYDMNKLDATMRNIGYITDFVSVQKSDPIVFLSQSTGMKFSCGLCEEEKKEEKCWCKFMLGHRSTTPEIKSCVADLKVLNKSDFKGLLTWRLKMQAAIADAAKIEAQQVDKADKMDTAETEVAAQDNDSDAEETKIQNEITALRQEQLRKKKRLKRKERMLMAKKRRRSAMNMDLNDNADLPQHDEIFSLSTIANAGDLEAVREIDLAKMVENDSEDDSEDEELMEEGSEDESEINQKLESELDAAYDTYLTATKDGMAKSGTKMAKRDKSKRKLKATQEAEEDDEIMATLNVGSEVKQYAKMLQGGKDSDDDESEEEHGEEDDGFNAEPMTPVEYEESKSMKKKTGNPLIHVLPEEPQSIKTARWFSNPLFQTMENISQNAEFEDDDKANDDDDDDDESVEELEEEEQAPTKITAEDVLASMPKTDKQIRHERRIKAMSRETKRQAKKTKLSEKDGDSLNFQVAKARNPKDDQDPKTEQPRTAKEIEARKLIRAGLGKHTSSSDNSDKFEVVPKSALPVHDKREYTSDNEEYDSDDHARTLALATMTLRKSKTKSLVDASYNRYAWNDPSDLPEWFVDDENKHYRPQLPIPDVLVQKMKERYLDLSSKPIAKVAEARARKNKRMKGKLAAAKKKAASVASSADMSEAMKLRQISKAIRGKDAGNTGKTYSVSKKGLAQGGKGIKMVDKRMKNDKRGMDRASKKKKSGKKGGLTGGKKRRSHS